MTTTVKRLPYDWYEIDAIEGWLDEQVREGLRLVTINGKDFHFGPTDGTLTRYRIHLKPERGYHHDIEYHESFADLGWKFVDSINAQADVYQAVRPDAVEINTDEEVLQGVIKNALRGELALIILSAAAILYWIVRQIKLFSAYGFAGIYEFMLVALPSLIVFALLLLAWAVIMIPLAKHRRAVKRRHLLSRDYHTPAVAKRRSRPHRTAMKALLLTLMLLVLMGVLMGNDGGKPQPCPVATLAAVNSEEFSVLGEEDIFEYHGAEILYSAHTYRWDFPSVMTADGWGYTPLSYVVGVETMKFPSWAKPYYRELVTTDRPWQQVDISGWDEAWYCAYEMTYAEAYAWTGRDMSIVEDLPPFRQQHLYLRDGSTIIHVDYNGATDLYPRLQELYGR